MCRWRNQSQHVGVLKVRCYPLTLMVQKNETLSYRKIKSTQFFQNVIKLLVHYEVDVKVWMISAIFEAQLCKWDTELWIEGKNVLLIVDSCPATKDYANTSVTGSRGCS